jgi:lipopolysaccharide export system permease protein
MKVLHKYIFKEYSKLFILCMVIFLSIYLIIDFLQRIDNFIEANVSKGITLSYFLYKIPHILVQMIPVGSLISVIILYSLMKKKNEVIALKACGLDILKLSGIVIIISLFIGIATFLLSEVIVPFTSSRSNEIWNIDVEKYNPGRFFGTNQIWYKSQNSIYWIRHFDSQKDTMESPTFYFFDDAFRLIKRIDGKKAVWTGSLWKI